MIALPDDHEAEPGERVMTGAGNNGPDALDRLAIEAARLHREQVARLLRLRARGVDIGHAALVLFALGDCLDGLRGHQRRLAEARP
ncbi:hypothetical protein D8770_16910 [Methylobacterium sp. DB1607]|nr:hypothetical protein [Methylobacterium sp. DB1607]